MVSAANQGNLFTIDQSGKRWPHRENSRSSQHVLETTETNSKAAYSHKNHRRQCCLHPMWPGTATPRTGCGGLRYQRLGCTSSLPMLIAIEKAERESALRPRNRLGFILPFFRPLVLR